MRLKSLELIGFKSFRDRTEITFDAGVTAIVGPNGCGKSNIVDAMKWILGEQRPTSLRSSEMQEVIYTGADGGPNFAQASLTFLNDGNALDIDYEEVCITRRLYRTGESEYLLNRKPCRLRDIRELFMGTGCGVESYSVMEQGRIDAILESRPEDRREVFDEAAGISLFKARKRESLRKLEKVDENLTRLHDIQEEVCKQIHSVKIQAGRARRFQELSHELKQKRVSFSLERFHLLEVERSEIEEELVARRADLETTRRALASAEAALAASQEILAKRQREIAEASADRERAESERERALERHRFAQQLLADLDARASAEAETARLLGEEIEGARRSLAAAVDRRGAIDREVEVAVAAFEAGKARLRDAESLAAAGRADVDRLRAAGAELLRERAELHNRLVELSTLRRGLEGRRERMEERRVEVGDESADLDQRLLGIKTRESEAGKRAEAVAASLDAARRAADSELSSRDEARESLNVERERQARKKARFEVLDGIDRRREGVATGPRAILDEAQREGSGLEGVRGLAADVLVVDVCHARAIEAALAERAQLLVVEDAGAALAALDFARSRGHGAVAALPLSSIEAGGALAFDAGASSAGAIGWAAALVAQRLAVQDRLSAVAQCLLGDVFVVRDRATALALKDAARERGVRLATLEGEVFEPWGGVSSGGALHAAALISRKSELRSLTSELERLDLDLGRRAAELEALEAKLRATEDEVRRLTEALRGEERRRETFVGERTQAEDRLSYLKRDLQAIEAECREVASGLSDVEARETDGRAGVAAASERLAENDRAHAVAESALDSAEAARHSASATLGDLKAAVADAHARREAIGSAIEREERALREAQGRLEASLREVEDLEARRARTKGEIDELTALVGRFEERVETLRKREAAACEGETSARGTARDAEDGVRAEREKLETLRESERGLELKLSECALKQSNLKERVRDEIGLDLDEMHASYEPAPIDAEALSRDIDELRGKIERLGNVNLDAIQELQSLEERTTFLEAQRSDLLGSKESLREVIRKIDQECQERFDSVFREIRTHFREIFRKLFGGGSADVFLVDESNPLESGVEITAKPPAKEMVSISLLSGGEKTMTAVALLFAIFRSKPSPFCILDEVDAALDDANIQRFVTMLREFLDGSQFIIITHSKKTMSTADVLYGITMEQSGVSKKIAVRFRDDRPTSPADAASTVEEALAVAHGTEEGIPGG